MQNNMVTATDAPVANGFTDEEVIWLKAQVRITESIRTYAEQFRYAPMKDLKFLQDTIVAHLLSTPADVLWMITSHNDPVMLLEELGMDSNDMLVRTIAWLIIVAANVECRCRMRDMAIRQSLTLSKS
jgi:hypothetical protein